VHGRTGAGGARPMQPRAQVLVRGVVHPGPHSIVQSALPAGASLAHAVEQRVVSSISATGPTNTASACAKSIPRPAIRPGEASESLYMLSRNDHSYQRIGPPMTTENGRNPPVTATCLHCGNKNAELQPPLADRSDYRCPTCGEYSVSATTGRLFEVGTPDPKPARFVTDADGRRFLKPL
jgi:hypothetical protein